jgi:hypothetical protein
MLGEPTLRVGNDEVRHLRYKFPSHALAVDLERIDLASSVRREIPRDSSGLKSTDPRNYTWTGTESHHFYHQGLVRVAQDQPRQERRNCFAINMVRKGGFELTHRPYFLKH